MAIVKTRDRILTRGQGPISHTNGFRLAKSADGDICIELLGTYAFPIDEDVEAELISNHITVVEADVCKSLLDGLCELTEHFPAKPRAKRKSIKKPATKK